MNHRIRTTARAPNTCHHTEMLLSTASRWAEKMLISDTRTSTTMKYRNTRLRSPGVYPLLKDPRVRSRKVAQP